MKWLTILAVFLVALTPMVLAQETETTQNAQNRAQLVREQAMEAKMVQQDVRAMRLDARQAMIAERTRVAALAKELQACRGQTTEECRQKRTEGKSTVRDTLTNSADHVLKMLEDAKARIEASDIANKEQIMNRLDAQIEKIKNSRMQAQELKEDSTTEQYREVTRELRQTVTESREDLKNSAHNLVVRRMGGVIVQAEQLEKRLENAIANLERKGADTSAIDLEAFTSKVDEAKRLHAEAIELFEKARMAEGQEKADFMKQSNQKLREAHAALKESHQILKDIVAQIKRVNQGAIDTEQSEESEETESEESETESEETESETA